MRTPATVLRIPVHVVLVMLPVGLWLFAGFCDLAYLLTKSPEWAVTALYSLAGGTIVAVIAAVPGLIDYVALRDKIARRIAFYHLISSVLVTLLMAVSVALRWYVSLEDALAYLISWAASLGLLAAIWTGAHMVHALAVGVDTRDEATVAEVPGGPAHEQLRAQ